MSTALHSALDPARTALLVLDCQPAVLAALPDADEREALLGRVARAVSDVRAAGGTVAHVRTAFTEADWDAVPAAHPSFGPLARHRVMHHEDPATAVHTRLAPRDGDIVVRKTRHGGLSGTGLDRRLRERGITALVLAGLSTSGAVLSTAVDAADRDYRLHVLSDGVADPDPEVHDLLLRRVLPARARIIGTADLDTLLRAD
ncbi:cysteine hydrolase family protein [Kitasatospora sp. NPDC056446]|uniref:cysteine hydrolase family protein n=1 Tax=Kitasatospora sp. NPDC056446 TaxID=3345819 RepID=UPI0036B1F8EF